MLHHKHLFLLNVDASLQWVHQLTSLALFLLLSPLFVFFPSFLFFFMCICVCMCMCMWCQDGVCCQWGRRGSGFRRGAVRIREMFRQLGACISKTFENCLKLSYYQEMENFLKLSYYQEKTGLIFHHQDIFNGFVIQILTSNFNIYFLRLTYKIVPQKQEVEIEQIIIK